MLKNKTKIILLLFFVFFLSSCGPAWEINVIEDGRNTGVINQESFEFYDDNYKDETSEIPLGQTLYDIGYTLIDEITFKSESDSSVTYVWDEMGETAVIQGSGEITLEDGTKISADQIEIETPSISSYYSIMDIAPTIAYAFNLPELPDTKGQVRLTESGVWDHAVMIFLDGLNYDILTSLIDTGKLPFFKQLNGIQQGITVFPPITTSSSAALLTGTPPKENGVYGYGYRTTTTTTLFDLFAEQGKSVTAVEGHSLAFNLRNAETILSGDRDENGFTNDNVFENSLEVIRSNMPDLLYIHFHDIDEMGHQYGPFSSEYETAIIQVDSYLEEIFTRLPEDTLITIFGDHGMHKTEDGGNHGTLTAADLIIPIIFIEK
ncbi:MAG: alkaline phosphatase family protein [Brevefilum sp.]|nr:alkaline phosphatase family protein [Brevefilum sp.]MDW7753660.1 alkaline phosphatase family protein [Brevefilum sp.]